MGREPEFDEEFLVTIADDGTIVLPQEIRDLWRLRAGDQVEFYQDHLSAWGLRPLTAGPLDFLESLPPRPRLPGVMSDEDALEKALAERNLPSPAIRAAG
jgi:AbrB family looped-hinge helix DNA binding protein